jgi:NADPH-dependent glutamate synthase beta subunit-like oxidoreductase/dihydroorotate dehydrogenase/Pyruvate/2-oxoacid:ferredoxin oxidoreductase delta subunit
VNKVNQLASPFMTWQRLRTELFRCEYCETRPCKDACPANCSPFDFIMAARGGFASDFARSAAEIMHNNPLGGVCGAICPDRFCMAACTRKDFDGPIEIPRVQATIVEMAKRGGGIPNFRTASPTGKQVAIVGGGPAGLGAAAALAQMGHRVEIMEAREHLGGVLRLVPAERLDQKVVDSDIDFVLSLGSIKARTGVAVQDPAKLLEEGFDTVCVTSGLWAPIKLGIENEDLAVRMVDLLSNPEAFTFTGRVAIVGGGATAVDCAIVARRRGARHIELFMLEQFSEMPLTDAERQDLVQHELEINGRIRISRIQKDLNRLLRVETTKVALPEGEPFKPSSVRDVPGTLAERTGFEAVVVAIGMKREQARVDHAGVFYAGDAMNGPTTAVEAVASGKNAAVEIDAWLKRTAHAPMEKHTKSCYALPGYLPTPVSLETKFFGRAVRSPYLLSASPLTDGLDQMTMAYENGWAGGIMKTAFDNVPIHIPSEYMFTFSPSTYANADNVSGHPLDRVCRELELLVRKWPDRLTMASTGGPVSGRDESDRRGWQSNTAKLEAAGAMGIEYSLSCPQGGDGTEGDIVSQNAALTAKIVDWVMEVGDPNIPKLFKLTAAVTSVIPILRAIRGVFNRYPAKKAGVTLANSFPTLALRPSSGVGKWEEGVIVGMSGEGVTPISNLTLAQAVPEGIEISGNAGPMTYKAAMDFLALGVKTVQFCTIATRYGYGIVHELESGTSHLMKERGLRSMSDLIGIAQPHPIVDFMALSPIKKISSINAELCVNCGNCTRCPYLAISPDGEGRLHTDPSRCIGCSICALKCFVGAITMRARIPSELAALEEA